MNPYSHVVIASKLETLVNPENKQEYYWGAIAPDVRYLTAMQRQQTHLPSQQIISLFSQYPFLKSFLQGYLIHCLSDEVELGQIFFKHFPFSVLKSKLSRQRIAVILEIFYFEKENVIPTISSAHNEVLSNLGISRELSEKFSKSISRYATHSSPESRLSELFELLGLENDSRIEKYRNAAISFQKNWFLKNGLFFGIKTGKIGEQIVSSVVMLYKQCSL
jgi:hypothetical protein